MKNVPGTQYYIGTGDFKQAYGVFYDAGWHNDSWTAYQLRYVYLFTGSVEYSSRDVCDENPTHILSLQDEP